MSPVKAKPRQLPRGKSKTRSSSTKAKATASDLRRNSRPQADPTRSRNEVFSTQNVSKALTGTELADLNREQELLQAQSLLAQIWHRNKNQHRGQKWWRWVGGLKRGVRDLVQLAGDDVWSGSKKKGGEEEAGEATLARKRMERERVRREKREQVEVWVREVVLGRCWLAFSTLVADSQFSTLGVVLLAILARVGRIVGLPKPVPAVPDLTRETQPDTLLATNLTQMGVDRGEVVERVFDGRERTGPGQVGRREEGTRLGNVTRRVRETSEEVAKGRPLDTELDKRDDQGVAGPLLKSTVGGESGTRAEAVGQQDLDGEIPAAVERKKKRRKKGNAIDELFAGLS